MTIPSFLRNLEHSTILYEDPKQHPLLRLAWNRQDPNYLATFAVDSSEVYTFNTLWGERGGREGLEIYYYYMHVQCT